MKKFIAVLACLYFTTHFTACTSGGSSEEAATDEAAISEDMSGGGDALGESESLDGSDSFSQGGDESADAFLDEQLPAEDLGETQPMESLDAAPSDQVAESAPAEPSMDTLSSEPAPTEEIPLAQDAPLSEPPAAFDSGPVAVDPGAQSSDITEYAPPAESISEVYEQPKAVLPYLKIQSAPYRAGGQLLNAVYIARPGDNFEKVSIKIYGDASHVKDLKKANSWISSVKPGNKIYYNSPKRPNDETVLLTYYEDQGIAPQVYISKQGDNLRKVASNLLGFDKAWKEIWASNPVESKGELAEGTELRYWPEGAASMATMAATEPEAMAPPPAELPPPPPVAAMEQLPPPPQMELPPPPAMELPPPPPPPAPMARKKVEQPQEESGMLTDDMIMALAGAGIIVAGLAAMVVIRKRRAQREMAAAFGDTQVGT